ncbi:patatin-like phospholipase family protein [Arthrospira platensis]|nr:patatin [Arthrospira platensis C1]
MAEFTRVLSIDGGGLRGLIPAEILVSVEHKIQEKTGNPQARLVEYFDLFAGTSAGGIMTCLYLSPDLQDPTKPRCSAEEARNFFYQNSRNIFYQPCSHAIKNFWGLLNEKYSHEKFELMMQNFFGDLKLSELLKPSLICSYEISRRKTHFFTQHDAVVSPSKDYYVRDVIRATSAAPTFFKVAAIRSLGDEMYTCVDGGVFANNPTLCAYAEARSKLPDNPTAKDMVILSLGTGDVKKGYPYEQARNWGQFQWLLPLFDIIMTGVAETVDYQMRQIYDATRTPQQYLRINTTLTDKNMLPIDKSSDENLQAIRRVGQQLAEDYSEELDAIVDLLLR